MGGAESASMEKYGEILLGGDAFVGPVRRIVSIWSSSAGRYGHWCFWFQCDIPKAVGGVSSAHYDNLSISLMMFRLCLVKRAT